MKRRVWTSVAAPPQHDRLRQAELRGRVPPDQVVSKMTLQRRPPKQGGGERRTCDGGNGFDFRIINKNHYARGRDYKT